jgi:hypothetical protein
MDLFDLVDTRVVLCVFVFFHKFFFNWFLAKKTLVRRREKK